MQTNITPKQKAFLDFVLSFQEENGYAPSQQEIAEHFGFRSLGTVQNYLVRLQAQGHLEKAWNARRGLQVVEEKQAAEILQESVELPILGQVAAGKPIEAIDQTESMAVPRAMVKKGKHFVLKVSGDSMIDEGIHDGDMVVIRKQANAVNGQTVVALIDNEATIKKYYKQPGKVELHPANNNYSPIIIDAQLNASFKIEGVLVGLMRQFD